MINLDPRLSRKVNEISALNYKACIYNFLLKTLYRSDLGDTLLSFCSVNGHGLH